MSDLISRQEALSFLRNWERVNDYSWGERNIIKATINEIESLPSAQPVVRTQMSLANLISRREAIDILDAFEVKIENGEPFAYSWARMRITELPSAQPEIIRCKDCRWRKDQSGSIAWLPCRAIVTPSDFYCGRAERRTDG